jgi:hypothetical protein
LNHASYVLTDGGGGNEAVHGAVRPPRWSFATARNSRANGRTPPFLWPQSAPRRVADAPQRHGPSLEAHNRGPPPQRRRSDSFFPSSRRRW